MMTDSALLARFLCDPAAELHPARRRQLPVWGLPEAAIDLLWRRKPLSLFLLHRFALTPAANLSLDSFPRHCLLLGWHEIEQACLRLGLARHQSFLRRSIAGSERRALAAQLGEDNLAFIRSLPPDLCSPAATHRPSRTCALAYGRDLLLAAADVPKNWRRRLTLKLPPQLPPITHPAPPPPALLAESFKEARR